MEVAENGRNLCVSTEPKRRAMQSPTSVMVRGQLHRVISIYVG